MSTEIPLVTNATMSPANQSALQLAAIGIPVFPLWGIVDGKCGCLNSSCRCPGKHPRHIASFNEATTNSALINLWFKEPHLNFAVRTGVEVNDSGKMLVVVDVDTYKETGTDDFDALIAEHGELPDTAEVLTGGGGRHLYFWAPKDVTFVGKLGRNIDFKVNGYVVGPGSLHSSNRTYEWEASSDLFNGQQVADLPQWIIEKFSKVPARTNATVAAAASNTVPILTDGVLLDIRTALLYLNADEYDVWLQVLMALKSTGADEQAYAIADAWSQRSTKYAMEGMRKKWQQIKADGNITLGTLIHLGREAYEKELKSIDISRLLARVMAAPAWPVADSFTSEIEAAAYPVEALPTIIADAVIEVQQFVQAPMAMVACSALATASVACQARNDVERARGLTGPSSLYFLIVAESGERKSTLDGHFSKPIHDYEKQQAMDASTKLKEYAADFAHWAATKKGLEQAATKKAENSDKAQNNTKDLRQALRDHEENKPTAPVIPRMIYRDATPEALLQGIAKEWPSVALMSSEGGIVLGGHGMSKDSMMRNLATINELWDGKPIRTDRRAVDASHSAEGRMTVAIQVQPVILNAFIESSAQQARGSGFLARFLVAHPKSTQGKRFFMEAPEQWPMLERYRGRITELLNLPQQVEHGRVNPCLLRLSQEAKVKWVAFHDEVEIQLDDDGELHNVRDVASKIADNAARLAALFHIIEGETGDINGIHMTNACCIARWHLNESRRLLNTPAPPAASDAQKLDKWIVKRCTEEGITQLSVTDIMQRAPQAFRRKEALEPILDTLSRMGRVKVIPGKPRMVHINPALLEVTPEEE